MKNTNKKPISDFFKNDYPAYGAYDNLRKIPSAIDGLKISQRKLLWTGFKKAKKEFVKTETFANLTALDTAYIHGSASLCTVCDSLVQRFVGAANYAFFTGNSGGWGCRMIPRSSAPRYTRLKLADIAQVLYNDVDNEIIEKQYFEGQWIEPKFLIPIFPVIFLNSSDGLSTGFSSKIYSRNPKEIIEYIKKKLSGVASPRMELLPWFRDFKGTIRKTADGCQESTGTIECLNTTTYLITELPIGTDYQKYLEFLVKQVENGNITDYEDACDPKTNEIKFTIKTTRAFTKKHSDYEKLLSTFKLVKSLPENLNCLDENCRVKEYGSAKEILDDFISYRLAFYGKRKEHLIEKFKNELKVLKSKFIWCCKIVTGEIVVSNKPKKEIIENLEKNFKNIEKINGDYSYLLNMPISSITKEKILELAAAIKEKQAELKKTIETSPENMWLEDLKVLEKTMKSAE